MRYALTIAGGSGTRLWPMSRAALPKQLIPFIGGRSLLEIAMRRLDGLVPAERRFVCAGQAHAEAIGRALPELGGEQFLGEPCGRDTLNAVGFSAAVLARRDPEAAIAVFTADHIIEPVDRFQAIVSAGWDVVERHPQALVTFGIAPTGPVTGYGYLELGDPFDAVGARGCGNSARSPTGPTARAIFRSRARAVPLEQRNVRVAGRHVAGLHPPLCPGKLRRVDAHRRRLADAGPADRFGGSVSPAQEDQRRFCRDGAGLARSGGGRGGRWPCRSTGWTWARGLRWPRRAPATNRAMPWRPSATC